MEIQKHVPLAIIGMACRLPGANSLEAFWQLLTEGRSGIVEVPPDRLNRQLHYDPERGERSKTYTSLGGLIEYRPFDASRCPVPPRTLSSAEVGHREVCQVAAEACRHAGMNPFDLPLRNVGVYVGHNLGGPVAGEIIYATLVEQTAQYLREVEEFRQAVAGREDAVVEETVRRVRDALPRRGPTGVPEAFSHIAAAIISEAFGLTGPSMILDAACSSALQGLAMASRALRLGQIDMAVVGGASYYHVDSQMLFSKAQSASATGSCPFDEQADGLVSGEGCVAVLVKRLDRALA
ncbi:MAG: polyketide synthase, partial [Pirellulales bacterium]|nr:polyketide synthase [Pirellulales bacterium]